MDLTAVVTGAARGIGRSVVARLRAEGYRVVAVDISPTVTDLAEEGWVVPLRADVATDEAPSTAIDRATATFGRLDLLVNNAARFLRRPILDTTDDDFDALFAVNVRPAFRFARTALPHLTEVGGCIVNVASISGLIGVPNQSVYAMTKGATVQLTRQLAIEYAARGVRVNAVAPGAVDTEFMADRAHVDRRRGRSSDRLPGLSRVRRHHRHDPQRGRRIRRPLSAGLPGVCGDGVAVQATFQPVGNTGSQARETATRATAEPAKTTVLRRYVCARTQCGKASSAARRKGATSTRASSGSPLRRKAACTDVTAVRLL